MGIADDLASKQKQASISEFFEKNKHFLGFDTLQRSLITAIKEGVDNSLDACEEARILPTIRVEVKKVDSKRDIIEIVIVDNGPGIPRDSIEKVFGQLLFGSRFHAIRQSRGQQGIGITGVVMYNQLTTGGTTNVVSKIASEPMAVSMDIGLDTKRNKAKKSNESRVLWNEDEDEQASGLKVTARLKAKYQKGRQSVWQYLRMTSIVNPHADITFIDPDGEISHWPRVTERLPRKVDSIKPHPRGIELGQLRRMLEITKQPSLSAFLRFEFSGVSTRAAKEMCEVAELAQSPKVHLHKRKPSGIKKEEIRSLVEVFQGQKGFIKGYRGSKEKHTYVEGAKKPGIPGEKVSDLMHKTIMSELTGKGIDDAIAYVKNHTDFYWEESIQELEEKILSKVGEGPWDENQTDIVSKYMRREWDPRVTFQEVKLLNPPTDCLSPIEEMLIKKGLSKAIDSRFVSTITRSPNVSHGNPFQIEVGLIFGKGMPADSHVEVLRFANRVPLMYQQGGCLLTKAIEEVSWKQYGLEQPGGKGLPKGPAAVLVHLASTNVQFTSEAKEALADNEVVFEEAKKAMQEMGRNLKKHLAKRKKLEKTREKFELINDILPAIAEKSAGILERPIPDLSKSITSIMSAVIAECDTTWNKETKNTDVEIRIFNYTSRSRAYSILAKWPEKEGATLENNEVGGRKEVTGVWTWKLPTLEPGQQFKITYSLGGLEKGDWTETEIFYRGSGDIIGAMEMDEKLVKQIRDQEKAESEPEVHEENETGQEVEHSEPVSPPKEKGQMTLTGGDF